MKTETIKIPFARPHIGEEEKKAVMDVLSGPILVHGPRAKQFEADFARYVRGGNAVSVSSCTAALHLAYFYLKLGAGDEVIVPAQTHTATAHAVELCGATPVFVDAELKTGNIDLDQIESKITPRTKAISIVHFLGMPVNMDRINQIAQKHKLFVVEDCALAIGTFYKGVHAGLHGDAGCFSFYPVKHMTTAEGGMFLTKHADVAAKIERQKAFGVDRTMTERAVPGVYEVTQLGFNYRLNEIQAAIGSEQIKRMDFFLKKRRENYEALQSALRGMPELRLLESTHGDYQSSYYCLSILLESGLADRRLEVVKMLNENGVGTSVYYPRPVPHMKYYREKYGHSETSFPAASAISYRSIALPVGPHLGLEEMSFIARQVKDAVAKYK